MKKIVLPVMMMGAALAMQAQDTYLNERMTNSGNDVYGTARYVGMGGSMGALGADISCMNYNPAGIGLYRRSDVAFTVGGVWNAHPAQDLKNARGTLDQMGFVYALKLNSDKVPFLNLGFNFQKKKNFSGAFFADNDRLGGLSQMDQLAELASSGFATDYNLAGAAQYYGFLTPLDQRGNVVADPENDKDKIVRYINKYNGELNRYTHQQSGSLKSYDLNLSANTNDRVYLGLTAGFESLRYDAQTDYYEQSLCVEDGVQKLGDYSLYSDYRVEGWGFNLKLGMIVRPLEENPLRVGVALETPTWYSLTSSTYYQLTDEVDQVAYHPNDKSMDEAYLECALRTPVKGRFSIGSTVGSFLAWNVDYEYSNYGKMNMGYPKNYNYDGTARLFSNEPDRAMNGLTKQTLRGMHALRVGVEGKPNSRLALRLGYNYATSPYRQQVGFDQFSLDSYAMDYATQTHYMRLGDTHTLTLGLGYKYKKFYCDLAYKLRNQKADFYSFDTSFTSSGNQFAIDNPEMANAAIEPVGVDLTRHQLTATLGFKF